MRPPISVSTGLPIGLALALLPAIAPAQDPPDRPQVVTLVSQVEGKATILSLLPERSRVKKGDLVCELDASALRDRLLNQEILVKTAEAKLQQANKSLEIAELGVREYLEGLYPEEEQRREGRVKIAESELMRAQERHERVEKLNEKGAVDAETRSSVKLELQRAEFGLREAETSLKVLRDYRKEVRVKQLQAQIEQARVTVFAAESTYALGKEKLSRLQSQIEKSKLLAPCDGLLRWANPPDRPHVIEVGATVRERQPIVEIVPARPAGPSD